MMRFLAWLLTPVFGVLALAIAQSLLHTWWSDASDGFISTAPIWVWFACPIAFGMRALWSMTCARMGWDNPWSFIDTLEHELTHALFGYLTLHPPVSLKATLRGEGEVMLKGQNVLTLLAPYFFPLFLTLSVVLSLGMAKDYRLGFTILCLGLLGSFLFRLMAEYRWRQTDLHGYGFFFSTAVVASLLLAMLGIQFSLLGLMSWKWVGQIPNHAFLGFAFLGGQGREAFSWLWNLLGIPFKMPG